MNRDERKQEARKSLKLCKIISDELKNIIIEEGLV